MSEKKAKRARLAYNASIQQQGVLGTRETWQQHFYQFMNVKGSKVAIPVMGYKDLDLYRLYQEVIAFGGFLKVLSIFFIYHPTSQKSHSRLCQSLAFGERYGRSEIQFISPFSFTDLKEYQIMIQTSQTLHLD